MHAILPNLLATFTGTRIKTDIQWYGDSYLGNLFRLWELVAWRKAGIRPEGSSGHNADGTTWHVSYTWENLIVRKEHEVKQYLKSWIKTLASVRVTIPQIAMPNGIRVPASPYLFAIAFNQATGFTAYSDTLAHTVSGSNCFLYTLDVGDGGALPSSWTCAWNGTAMTAQTSLDSDAAGADRWSRVFLLGAAATGSFNIVAAGSTFNMLGATSYSGAQSSSIMDSGAVALSSTGAGTATATTTVVGATCWLVAFCNYVNNATPVSSGGVSRGSIKDNEVNADSNASVAAGARSIVFNKFGTASAKTQIISFREFAAGPTTVKTWQGITFALVKTGMDVAVASIKSINGAT